MPRAVRFDRYGGTDVLYIAEVDAPRPSAGELVVAVRAASINPGEASIREGYLHSRYPATFPSGEGSDLAGVVTEAGAGADAFTAGDEVLGWTDERASHADYVVVPEGQLIPKPGGMSWEAAGSMHVVGSTAYAAATAVGAGPGDTVAVSAAAGGVGSIVVQLLKVRGAEVIGVASEANHDWLTSVGVTPVAYGDGLAGRIRAVAPAGIDAFIDTFGEQYVRLAIELGVAPDRIDTTIAFAVAAETGIKAEGSSEGASIEALTEMTNLVASGQITVPIAAVYPLDQVHAAYEDLAARHTRGKIVLIP